ncbi:Longin-like domain-containing protein [Mrakia frigida]|uniref:TRAPP subunit TRS23 n=1 Tax=Mrakia frigida TaxID=29902 RepID=UPI003FCC0047
MSAIVYSLWVINKAGGLVYDKQLNPGLPPISQNDALILAGTLHGIHAITGKLSPVDGAQEGVETIEGDGVKMIILLTATGTKFVLLVSPSYPTTVSPSLPSSLTSLSLNSNGSSNSSFLLSPGRVLLGRIYEAYSDSVMKNPFHTPEMPIRNEGFDTKVEALVRSASFGGVGV